MQHKYHFKSLVLGIATLLAMSGTAVSQEEEKAAYRRGGYNRYLTPTH